MGTLVSRIDALHSEPIETFVQDADDKLIRSVANVGNQIVGRPLVPAYSAGPELSLRYFDLIAAHKSGDEIGAKRDGAIVEIAASIERGDEPWQRDDFVKPWSHDLLGADSERLQRLLFNSAHWASDQKLETPATDDVERLQRDFAKVASTLPELAPAVWAEVQAFLQDIIVVSSSHKTFGGVTSVIAWGATVIGAPLHKHTGYLFSTVVHEVTHGALYALNVTEALVLNPLSDRFPSALRPDPRPMDGVFHALAVSARLAHFWQAVPTTLLAELDIAEFAAKELDDARSDFAELNEVVEAHAVLSPTGEEVLHRVRAMAAY